LPLPAPYGAIVAAAEREEHLPAYLVHAVMRQESAFDPPRSHRRERWGAPAHPSTAEAIARELAVEHDRARLVAAPYNVRLGARYLRGSSSASASTPRWPPRPTMRAAGPLALARVWRGAPPRRLRRAHPYPETRGYEHRVLGNLARYAYLAGCEAAVPALELAVPKGKRALPDDF
jgi:soluble lytic murein transglycosylase